MLDNLRRGRNVVEKVCQFRKMSGKFGNLLTIVEKVGKGGVFAGGSPEASRKLSQEVLKEEEEGRRRKKKEEEEGRRRTKKEDEGRRRKTKEE